MTHKIPKSVAGSDFEVRVAAHAKEIRDWKEQMAKVKSQANDPKISTIDRWVSRHKPTEHEHIMAAVNDDGLADFVLVDDGPSPEQALEAKKNNLINLVTVAEQAAINAVVPRGKVRMFNIREGDIREADRTRIRPGLADAVKAAVGINVQPKTDDAIEKARPADDTKFLADQKNRREKVDAVIRAVANMLSDIDDLTIDNVDAWKMPDFPK